MKTKWATSIASGYFIVHSQLWKYSINVSNLFQVNCKFIDVVLVLLFVNFEQMFPFLTSN